jgi:ADP-heptose:LPS heptosyltransferase
MMVTDGPILVIKLGALGDFVQATGPFAAIRKHHSNCRVVLLTTSPFADMARAGGWFDEVCLDRRPAAFDVAGGLALRKKIRGGGFSRVYDLQTSDRSNFYFRLFWPGTKPEWSGIAKGCSHPHTNPRRDSMHTLERQAEQLNRAGIDSVPPPDLSCVAADIARFGVPEPFALLVPGGAHHRPAKRWPVAYFRTLAEQLASNGITPVVIGSGSETGLAAEISSGLPAVRNLVGQTSLLDLAALSYCAWVAIGNDTGPMHVAAIAGCHCLALYSDESDPTLCAQRGPNVTILRREALELLDVDAVVAALPSRSPP